MCLLQVWYRCVLINIHVGHVWDRCILINRKKVAVHVVLPWLHTRGGPHLAQAKRCEQQSGLLLLAAKLKLPQTNTLRMGEIKSCSPLFNHQTRQSQHAFTAFPFDSTHMGSFSPSFKDGLVCRVVVSVLFPWQLIIDRKHGTVLVPAA